ELHCKLRSHASCDGGRLTEREDTEEAQLIARTAAFDQSPEGRGRARIWELVHGTFSREGLSPAEQGELDNLQARYPELPRDPDDPNTQFWEDFEQKAREGYEQALEAYERTQHSVKDG